MSKKYYQCDLMQGGTQTTAWIEDRGAILGVAVEIPDLGPGLWKVTHVYNIGLSKEEFQLKKKLNRNSLSSIKKDS